jgi:hypothetical protein
MTNTELSWTVMSSLAAVIGVLVSAFTFWKSFSRMKRSEQVKMAHDIGNNLTQAENEIRKVSSTGNHDDIKYSYMQYLNVWEWFAFLVNKDQITIKEIINYHKPTLLKDYDNIFAGYPDLKNDNTKYKEFKVLYEKLKKD